MPEGDPVPDGEKPPWRSDPYAEDERYGVLRAALESPSPTDEAERIVEALQESGLRGMGGAGFATGTKWRLIQEHSEATKYVVCNADESEPGTFKDRVILNELPHLVVEGAIIAARAIGAHRGWIFIRHEYEAERDGQEKQFTRYAATWLNKESWLNEPTQNHGDNHERSNTDRTNKPAGTRMSSREALCSRAASAVRLRRDE